jgi:hypothetical protein
MRIPKALYKAVVAGTIIGLAVALLLKTLGIGFTHG